MKKHCPKKVLKAVKAYAKAVRRVYKMSETESPHDQEYFHVVAYLPDMETLLIHQVLTAFPTPAERESFLEEVGMGYLTGEMLLTERSWEEQD